MVITDLEALRRSVDAGQAHEFLPFYGHQAHPKGKLTRACLSQWFDSPFTYAGESYPTAEHFMMAEKARLFGDAERERQILDAPSPYDAKMLGRQVRGFTPERWTAKRFDIVVTGNIAKFGSTDALRGFLIATGERVLVEASPTDRIWGIGMRAEDPRVADPHAWQGLNLLGFALMVARDQLG